MKKAILYISILCLVFGCSGLDPYMGKTLYNGIAYIEFEYGEKEINWELINLRLIDYEKKSNSDTLLFHISLNEAKGENGSFNTRVEHRAVTLTFSFYLLDEDLTAFDKVVKIKRIERFPSQMAVDIPHNNKMKYIAPNLQMQWWVIG